MNSSSVLPGIDALLAGHHKDVLSLLSGRRLGLLTNHTGCTQDGKSTLDVLRALDLNVRAIFSPEHGFAGTREGHIESSQYENLPVHSLYGETRRPTAEMLAGIEVLVCDLQDVGARFYTYASTLAQCLEECAKLGIAVVVLDRPNPIGGVLIEGPTVDEENKSFVGYLNVPIRHGMTIGELALLHEADMSLDVEIQIAKVHGWQREMLWPDTNLKWPVPSPNLPDWISAAWYPGICLLEFSGVSVGRGTESPFQIIGAPWMDAVRVLDATDKWPVSVREDFSAEAIKFTPTRGEHEGVLCHGFRFEFRGARFEEMQTVPLGLCLLSTLHTAHEEFKLEKCLTLLGSDRALESLRLGNLEAAVEIGRRGAKEFAKIRGQNLIY